MLGAGTGDSDHVGFLERVRPDQCGGHLAGDGHQGNGIHQGVRQTRNEVGRARSRGGDANAHFSCGLGITFGHMDRSLLVARVNQADPVAVLVKGVKDGKNGPAGQAPEHFHALFHHDVHDHLGTSFQFGFMLRHF